MGVGGAPVTIGATGGLGDGGAGGGSAEGCLPAGGSAADTGLPGGAVSGVRAEPVLRRRLAVVPMVGPVVRVVPAAVPVGPVGVRRSAWEAAATWARRGRLHRSASPVPVRPLPAYPPVVALAVQPPTYPAMVVLVVRVVPAAVRVGPVGVRRSAWEAAATWARPVPVRRQLAEVPVVLVVRVVPVAVPVAPVGVRRSAWEAVAVWVVAVASLPTVAARSLRPGKRLRPVDRCRGSVAVGFGGWWIG
ncbi:hypothetical protein NIIDMKKI_77460 [Mycobacterium kansasii]|uniref:Uncharacterized protein n=1 Tax=Mycobacterium kansasii TaxID=1768 RepID=A0A7G1INV9_MYCKA|nr:hypothetical protein NIIDMKKI_77460 [Mycobacterium kansasii]